MYTVAPDGIGLTMREGASPLPYTKDTVTYIPWEEGSKLEPLNVGSKLPSGSVAYTKTGAQVDLNKSVMKNPRYSFTTVEAGVRFAMYTCKNYRKASRHWKKWDINYSP